MGSWHERYQSVACANIEFWCIYHNRGFFQVKLLNDCKKVLIHNSQRVKTYEPCLKCSIIRENYTEICDGIIKNCFGLRTFKWKSNVHVLFIKLWWQRVIKNSLVPTSVAKNVSVNSMARERFDMKFVSAIFTLANFSDWSKNNVRHNNVHFYGWKTSKIHLRM